MCTIDNEFYPTGGPGEHAAGTIFEDIGDALSSAADWSTQAVSNAMNTIHSIPVLSQIADVLISTMAPGVLTALFTNLPGVGTYVATALTSLGPVAQNALPGLVRGERVDRALIASALDLGSRLGPAAIGAQLPAAVSFTGNKLKEAGIDPKELAAKADELRVASGLTTADQVLPPEAQAKLDASLKPLLDRFGSIPQVITSATQKALQPQIDKLKALAKEGGVSPAAMQLSIDGATRTSKYDPRNFDDKGNVRDVIAEDLAGLAAHAADDARAHANAITAVGDQALVSLDSSILSPIGATSVWDGSHYVQKGGRFQTAAQIYEAFQKDTGSFGGALARIPYGYITDRIAYFAKLGRRPADPVVAFAEALAAKAVGDLRAQGADALAKMSLLSPTDPQRAALQIKGSNYLAQSATLDALEQKTLASEKAERALAMAEPTTQLEYFTQGQIALASLGTTTPNTPEWLAAKAKGIAYTNKAAEMAKAQGLGLAESLQKGAVAQLAYDRFAEREKITNYYLGFAHAAQGLHS